MKKNNNNTLQQKQPAQLHRVVISGGGTGGHIFPAIAIANELRSRFPNCQILFVGADGRMEVDKVPAAGYEIMTLPVRGLRRDKLWANVSTLWLLAKSLASVHKLLRRYRPQLVVGVGGYASAPTLMVAQMMGIPTLVQEQNSYAGVTNKIVGRRAKKVCVAYKGMERFFPANKIVLTGNPVRQDLFNVPKYAPQAYNALGLNPNKRTLLVLGGSLGAKTINESVAAALPQLAQLPNTQVLWQTGKNYIQQAHHEIARQHAHNNVIATDFIYQMHYAFAVADLVISRAGAGSISELCLLGLPTILVPSPNVAEDHQTKNAQALVKEQAAVMVQDSEAKNSLIGTALNLLQQPQKLSLLSQNIRTLALPNSAQKIANLALQIVYPNTIQQ